MTKLQRIVKKRFDRYELKPEKQGGFLGMADGTVRVPGRRHWVYVRLWNGDVVEAYNQNVPVSFGLAVDVIYRGGRYYVQARQVYDQVVNTSIPDGLEEELQWPNSHTLYVRGEQLVVAGLVYPKSGLTVYVAGSRRPLPSGGYVAVEPRELDLSPYVPASGAIWALIALQDDGSVSVTTGGAADNWAALSLENIPAAPSGGYPVAAVRLFHGQTAIQHGRFGSHIEDLRWSPPLSSSTSMSKIVLHESPAASPEVGKVIVQWVTGEKTLALITPDGLAPRMGRIVFRTAAPTSGDDQNDGYQIGDLWADGTNKKVYACTDPSSGAAVWKELGSGGIEGVKTDATLIGDGTSSNPLGVIENVVTATVTSADVMAEESSLYVLDLSGLTANRDFVLPTPSVVGKRIKVKINVGNDTYSLIIKKNEKEVTRLFITGETLEFVSVGTEAKDWVVTQDGRIPCLALFRRVGSDANTTHAADTWIKAEWNDIALNIGNCADLTNIRFTARRAGYLRFWGKYFPVVAVENNKLVGIRIYKNGTAGSVVVSDTSQNLSSANITFNLSISGRIAKVLAQPGDFYEYFFYTNQPNLGLLRSDIGGGSLREEATYFQIEEVLRPL